MAENPAVEHMGASALSGNRKGFPMHTKRLLIAGNRIPSLSESVLEENPPRDNSATTGVYIPAPFLQRPQAIPPSCS
jgi:hypothetical protein